MSCEPSADPLSGEESDDPDFVPIPRITPEDWERYQKQVEESDGFDVDDFPGIRRIPGCISHVGLAEDEEHMTHKFYVELLTAEIDKHNQHKKVEGGTSIEFERIIKLNARYPAVSLYYTFEARDVPDGTKRTYQARLDAPHLINDADPMIFREKPSSNV